MGVPWEPAPSSGNAGLQVCSCESQSKDEHTSRVRRTNQNREPKIYTSLANETISKRFVHFVMTLLSLSVLTRAMVFPAPWPATCFLLASFLLVFFSYRMLQRRERQRFPPGPQPLPLVGNVFNLPRGPLGHAMADLSSKYGAQVSVASDQSLSYSVFFLTQSNTAIQET